MTTEAQINYFDDEAEKPEPPPQTLERLMTLAADAKALESEINADSVALAEKQDRLDKILKEHIPDIMDGLGLEDFKLKDGSKIVVKDDIKCGISEANKPAAHMWLRENEFDGIIKTQVIVAFGKGEAEEAERARTALIEAGFLEATVNDSVHHSTLKSFVKE